MLLVDKYNPNEIKDIIGNGDVISILESVGNDFPHLLFTGPPGTGKTTVAHIIRKNFNFLELNASDERGIETIRVTLKNFCNKNIENKLIILDECDHLTTAAQQALRRIMETTDVKFILICNQISGVIEPLQSRCAVLKFDKITNDLIIKRLKEICKIENINITENGFECLINISGGDMRACLNCLESLRNIKNTITDDFLYKINGIPNFKLLENILNLIKNNKMEEALEIFNNLWIMHYESSDILDGFFKVGKNWENYEILKIIGRYQLRINEGVNSKIQFYGLFFEIGKLFNGTN